MWVPITKLKTEQKPKEANKLNMEEIFRECSHYTLTDIANVKITYWLMKNSSVNENNVRMGVMIDFSLRTKPHSRHDKQKD